MPRPMPCPPPVTIAACPSRLMRSPAAELGVALFLERPEAFRSVLGREELGREPDLVGERGLERHGEPNVHGALRIPEAERRAARPEAGHLESRLHLLSGRHDPVHEADPERLRGIDWLGR